MNLPKTILDLVEAQNNFDSKAYAACFSPSATVVDEGHTYNGRTEISSWIDKANQQYQATMEPVEYNEADQVLQAKITGNFPGSPIVLSYQLAFSNELIQSLKIV